MTDTAVDKTDLTTRIINVLNNKGPMLGKELVEELNLGTDYLPLWQACFQSQIFQISHFSRYYLRYDLGREDLIRLSPSILRDFLSFTLIALPHQRSSVIDRRILLSNRHMDISVRKLNLARSILVGLGDLIDQTDIDKLCAFIAGDIAYYLGHDEPRECHSLGEMVNGSDIDIIIIHEDVLATETIAKIDRYLSEQKYFFLKAPNYREELDFIAKPVARFREQLAYETIQDKIACKILYESMFVYGSARLYMEISEELTTSGVRKLIDSDLAKGIVDRREAIQKLLSSNPNDVTANEQSLFFFSQERVEFT